MLKSTVDFSETGYFSSIILDYIDGHSNVSEFYKYAPALESFANVIKDKQAELIDRKILVEVLNEQNRPLPDSIKVQENILSLQDNTSFTITTGHQLCIFTGPLYFFYKIISTIKLTQALKNKYPEYNFIPIYWMAGEDHDFEEINHIHLYGKKIVWEQEQKGPTGKISTKGLKDLLEELKISMGTSENALLLASIFEDAYSHPTLAEATRRLIHALFGMYGLVTIDGSDKRLKNNFSSILKDDILNNSNFKLVQESINSITKKQYKVQVNPRPINCFYMLDGLRERIEKSGEEYIVLNTQIRFTENTLLNEIETYPERFSPNVVLRPLYQEKTLPNLAYIGGPGELAYWLEYKRLFAHHHVNFPILVLRNCVMLLDSTISDRLKKAFIDKDVIFQSVDDLIRIMIQKNGSEISFDAEEKSFKELFEKIKSKAGKADTSLMDMVEAELQKQLKTFKIIESKVLKAEKQKQEIAINQLKKIKGKLFPDGQLQERFENFIPYFIKYGPAFAAELIVQFDALQKQFIILSES
jgi:bacillithiol biosynthesis cysteine-adding enzyme BshC